MDSPDAPKITMVKKVLASGETCRKCREIEARLTRDGYQTRIHEVLLADERQPDSAGWRLARQHRVERAPFFVVEHAEQPPQVYDIYYQLVREVLQPQGRRGPTRSLGPSNSVDLYGI